MSKKNFVPRDRVDFETARALKLLGMPQGFVINAKNIARLHEPHYVWNIKTKPMEIIGIDRIGGVLLLAVYSVS